MSSIREAQAQLKQYKNDLPRKCEKLARRLAMLGAETANVTFAGAVYDLDAKYHRPLEQADIEQITESGCSGKYMFVFAVKDPAQALPAETVENVTTIYVQKDHITEAFSDIVF